jgi:hypothetical protein
MAIYLIKLLPHDQAPPENWSEPDRKQFDEHLQYWHGLMAGGKTNLYGRVEDPENPYCFSVVDIEEEPEITGLIEQDPGKSLFDFKHFPMTHMHAR